MMAGGMGLGGGDVRDFPSMGNRYLQKICSRHPASADFSDTPPPNPIPPAIIAKLVEMQRSVGVQGPGELQRLGVRRGAGLGCGVRVQSSLEMRGGFVGSRVGALSTRTPVSCFFDVGSTSARPRDRRFLNWYQTEVGAATLRRRGLKQVRGARRAGADFLGVAIFQGWKIVGVPAAAMSPPQPRAQRPHISRSPFFSRVH
jgi:hypothetical protein